jgi:hypothetical protein
MSPVTSVGGPLLRSARVTRAPSVPKSRCLQPPTPLLTCDDAVDAGCPLKAVAPTPGSARRRSAPNIWIGLAWCVGILIVACDLAMATYRHKIA